MSNQTSIEPHKTLRVAICFYVQCMYHLQVQIDDPSTQISTPTSSISRQQCISSSSSTIGLAYITVVLVDNNRPSFTAETLSADPVQFPVLYCCYQTSQHALLQATISQLRY